MFHVMDRDRRPVFACALAVGVLVLGFPSAGVWAAGVALDADFEAPAYTTTGGTLGGGVLQGQSGWLWDGTGLDPNVHSTAVVQDSIFKTGSQAVLVTRRPNSNRHWAMPKSGLPTQRFIAIDWDMRVAEASASTGLGPFFGLHTYDRTLGSPPKVLGTLGVDATTGEILTQQAQTGFFASTEATVLFDEWNHYRLVLDFATDSFLGFVNGEHVISSPFVDDNPTQDLNTFSDADLWTVAGAADAASQALTGTAAFDNFVIRDGLLGDYDIDGDVDNGDYLRWRATFGQSVTAGHDADGNKNGVVDAADYVIWREHLGDSLFTNGLGAGLSSAVVPEPGSLVLGALALSVIAFTTASRRR
jgi:hypothetical protein